MPQSMYRLTHEKKKKTKSPSHRSPSPIASSIKIPCAAARTGRPLAGPCCPSPWSWIHSAPQCASRTPSRHMVSTPCMPSRLEWRDGGEAALGNERTTLDKEMRRSDDGGGVAGAVLEGAPHREPVVGHAHSARACNAVYTSFSSSARRRRRLLLWSFTKTRTAIMHASDAAGKGWLDMDALDSAATAYNGCSRLAGTLFHGCYPAAELLPQ
jgi:hypothetical protein